MPVTLYQGDCLTELGRVADVSADACITDPPYELGFMGRTWDSTGIANSVTLWREVYRVLKPGGHLLAFGGTRTYHRMVCAIEDAGFEIRDSLDWLYGSGFPKSHNLTGDWHGWGTALKPAHEPIVLARKPLIGTVAANVLAYGAGAINVDACRVGTVGGGWNGLGSTHDEAQWRLNNPDGMQRTAGRWPPNVLLTHDPNCNGHCVPGCPVGVLDAQAGTRTSGAKSYKRGDVITDNWHSNQGRTDLHRRGHDATYAADSGTASRFYPTFAYEAADFAPFRYCGKASRRERNAGCEGLPKARSVDSDWVSESRKNAPSGGVTSPQANHHPTVKPLALMRWLCTLITPPGGTILDPFLGSGTTGVAAIEGGWPFIGCEQDADSYAIAAARCAAAQTRLHQLTLQEVS